MASDDEGGLDLFQEPADYFEPEKEATFATHKLLSGNEFSVRLVGHNPLKIAAEGYLWGASTEIVTSHLTNDAAFDVLILADLLFNHSEHAKLIKTVELTLKKSPTSKAYVFFTPYRPWLLEKDLAFFDLAREAGFTVVKTLEKVMDKVMFEEDPGVSRKS
ncbi:Protein N-terminal and lysine N-methyltransferase efm7 [Didymella pomorum]